MDEERMKGIVQNLLLAGTCCSNVCCNLSQRDTFSAHDQDSMRASYRAWDAAVGEARGVLIALTELAGEVTRMKVFTQQLADRVAAQAELLARRAERSG